MGRTCPVSSRLDSALVRYFLRHAYESKAQPRFRRSPARRHRPPPDRRAAGGGAALPRRAGPPGRALVPRRGRAIEPAGGGGSDPRLPRGDRPPRGGLRAQRRDPHPARAAGAAQGRRRRARHARDRPVRPRDRGGLLRDARPRARRGAPRGGHRPLRDLRPDDVVDRAVLARARARRGPGMSRWGRAGRYRARLARLVRDWGQQHHWCFDEAERRMQRASRLDGVRPPERFAGRHETLRRELAARQEVRSRTDIEDAARVDLALAASERIDRLLAEIAAEAQTAEEQEYSRALEDLAARRRQEFDRALELADETGRRALG